MEEQVIEMLCPMCHDEDNLRMIAHVDEIPYFGEHTQVTVLCHACGWRQTDFIPAEGRKPAVGHLKSNLKMICLFELFALHRAQSVSQNLTSRSIQEVQQLDL